MAHDFTYRSARNAASSRPRPSRGAFRCASISSRCSSSSSTSRRRRFIRGRCKMHALRVFGLLEMVVFIVVLGDRLRVRVEEGRLRVAMSSSPGQFMLARLDDVARWAQSSSVWPLTMGLACCAIEMMTVTSSEYDIARFGSEVFRSSPRQADLMIVSGRVAQKMAPGRQAPLRSDGRSEVGHLDGRLRELGRHLRQLCDRPRRRHDRSGRRLRSRLSADARRVALRGQPDSTADPRGRPRRHLARA